MANNAASLFVVAAPSGAGKTSLVREVVATLPGVVVSVSHTTREPRPQEAHGVDYFFIKPDEFASMVQQNAFLEHAEVFGYYYGTSRQFVTTQLEKGLDVILEIDWQGARQIKALFPEAVTVFILPPSEEALRERLMHRAQDSSAVIERRMLAAKQELSHYAEFDYLFVNERFADAKAVLSAIILARRHRLTQQNQQLVKLLNELLA